MSGHWTRPSDAAAMYHGVTVRVTHLHQAQVKEGGFPAWQVNHQDYVMSEKSGTRFRDMQSKLVTLSKNPAEPDFRREEPAFQEPTFPVVLTPLSWQLHPQ